jgi:WD40 repeat protein
MIIYLFARKLPMMVFIKSIKYILGLILLMNVQGIKCFEKKKEHEAASTQSQGQTKAAQKESIMMSIMRCPQLRRIPVGPWRNFVTPAAASIDPVLPLTVRPHAVLQHKRSEAMELGVVSAHFSHDGTEVVTVAYDKVAVWQLRQKKEDRVMKNPRIVNLKDFESPKVARFNRAGTALLIGHEDGVGIYDAQNGKCLQLEQNYDHVNIADFNHDESQVVIGADDEAGHVLAVWDLKNNYKYRYRVYLDENEVDDTSGPVKSASFNNDGTKVVSGVENVKKWTGGVGPGSLPGGRIIIWNLETGQPIHGFKIEKEELGSCCCSPDGTKVLGTFGGIGSFARLWDVQSGKQVGQFQEPDLNLVPGFKPDLNLVANFNHDGTQIVSGTYNGKACIRDANSFQKLVRLAGPTQFASSVEFNHDGSQVLMTCNSKKNVPIWNVPVLKDLHRTTPQQSHLMSLLTRCKEILKSDPKKRKSTEFYLASIPKAKKFDQAQTQEFMDEARATLNSFDPIVKAAIIKNFKIKDADQKKAKE